MDGRENIVMGISVRLFGPFSCMANDALLPPLRSRRGYLLLASLILRGGRTVSRETLMASLWPESDTKNGQENLRRTLTDLRRALGTEAYRIVSDGHQSVRFVLDDAVFADVLRFDALAARWEKISDLAAAAEAITLYRGTLLEGFDADWLPGERAAREEQCREMLESPSRRALHDGDAPRAVTLARRAERLDPLNAIPQRLLYEALAATGDAPAVQRAYREFRDRLHRETNQEPDEETRRLVKGLGASGVGGRAGAIRAGASPAPTVGNGKLSVGAGLAPALPPTALVAPVVQTPPVRIPFPVSELIGREAETEEVASLLAARRLITLTGTGGVGKTRLALEVAARSASNFPDGVYFVDLSPLTDPAQVLPAVARMLEMPEANNVPLLDALRTYLVRKRALLIVDNCEHLLESCAVSLAALLESLPELSIMATSRMPLGIAGEQVWRVPSLAFPDPATPPPGPLVEALQEYDGPRLFVERARASSSAFSLTEKNAPAILQICARLDGIPLALELAAARIASLSAEQIQERLEDAFRLLTTGAQTALPRQRTLRALVDWSYDLLDEPERALLRRLSAFAGGWTLEAAEAVCSSGGGERATARVAPTHNFLVGAALAPVPSPSVALHPLTSDPRPPTPAEVLDVLTGLVDKSLVLAADAGGAMRYRMLETIRQYAQERLIESGERETVQARHRDYFLSWAEAVKLRLSGSAQGMWLSLLEAEHDNFRQALAFCLEEADGGAAGLRLGEALQGFWMTRGHLSEGRERLTAILSHPGAEERTRTRAEVLKGTGKLAEMQGDYSPARSLYADALAIFREIRDRNGVAAALNDLGNVNREQGDYASAISLYKESLTIFRASGDNGGIAQGLGNLAYADLEQGEYVSARARFEETIALQRELGDGNGVAHCLVNLGIIAREQGDYAAARSLYEQGLTIFRELGNRNSIASLLNNLGNLARDHGEYAAAQTLYAESLTLRRELGDRNGVAVTLNSQGNAARDQGDDVSAHALYGECLAIFREVGDKMGVAYALNALGLIALDRGDYAAARSLFEEGLALFRDLSDKNGVAGSLFDLGELARRQADYSAAFSLFKESLRLQRELKDKKRIASTLDAFASLALHEGYAARAALLWAAEITLRDALGSVWSPLYRTRRESGVAAARASLSEVAFAAAWESGRAMTWEQAAAYVLEEQ